jgi:Lectin C-type domain
MRTTSLPILCLLIVIFTACSSIAMGEPVQWSENGHWYELVTDGMPWSEARETAESSEWMGQNGYLATITSPEEQQWVWELIEPEFAGTIGVWLGGYQDPPDSQPADANWRWVTDEPWDFTNWASSAPNDYQGQEECLEFWELSLSLWNDQPDFRPNAFLVEYDEDTSAAGDFDWGDIKILFHLLP